MSFSSEIKDEIAHQFPNDYHCLLAELAAIIHYAGTLSGNAEHGSIAIETENVVLAKRFLRLIRRAFDISVNLDIKKRNASRNHLYRVILSSEAGVNQSSRDPESEETVQELEVGDKFSRVWMETADWEQEGFKESILDYSCCRRAFLRGAFLTSGSMSNPGKSYHFEIVCRKQQGAQELSGVMQTFGITPGIVKRKNKFVVYLKDSNAIVEILNIIQAHRALVELENIRIIKEMKNSANRQYNCDSANINKIVRTATRQVEDIQYIRDHLGFEKLSAPLREMALVRLAHPEESLQELGTYLDPPVGKSGVNHRLKKLGQIAEDLRR